MAGYSGTPLARKLGIKADHTVTLLRAPERFEDELEGLEEGVRVLRGLRGKGTIDVALSFVTRQRELDETFARLIPRLAQTGGLWIAWPKKASGMATEVDESHVRATGLATGLVDNKICAVNETWSGLRFVIRVENRRPASKATPARRKKA